MTSTDRRKRAAEKLGIPPTINPGEPLSETYHHFLILYHALLELHDKLSEPVE
jgi:hypothetical protein